MESLFSPACQVDIQLDPGDGRKKAFLDRSTMDAKAWVYHDTEDVQGRASVSVKPGKTVEHQGIKVEIVGQVVNLNNRLGNHDFFAISKDLEPPGTAFETKNYEWKFKDVDFCNETYRGKNVNLRYFVRLSVIRAYGGVAKETDLIVRQVQASPELDSGARLETGIDGCLDVEILYEKEKYHLQDCVIGTVRFSLVRIKIICMELSIDCRETVGSGTSKWTANDKKLRFEVMDGAPTRGEVIPVRLYMKGLDLTPTYKNVQNKFSVQYFLNMVLIDEEGRRYFKKKEVVFYRKGGQ